MVNADITALVVSGTADSGEALVQTVAEAGGTVGFTYNSAASQTDELLDNIPGDGHEAWQCNVTDADETRVTVDRAFDVLGHVDAVVFTVGIISRAAVDEIPSDEWQDHLDTNVTGAYNVVHAVAPHLKSQSSGSIVALSASEGVLRSANLAAYDTSKRGLEALIQETARDLGPHGVRANVVAPGFIRNPEVLSADQHQDLFDQQVRERVTTPQDVADACLFLASEDAASVTGVVLPVDNGLAL